MTIIYLIAGGGLTVWCVLTWFLGTILKLTGTELLFFRISMIVLGVLAVAGIVWYYWRQKKQESAATAEADDGSGDEIDVLIRDAEQRLAGAGQRGRVANLPVVFVAGDAGCAKTCTVIHSGLEPELLSGQVYQNNNVVPTRAANLWFARKAVLVEAGSKLLADAGRWQRLVRRLRPRAAVGKGEQAPRAIVVCFDCETFTRPGAAEAVTAAARNLRNRLGEISETFGINLPVYALFTKMDRVPFFADYVRNLTGEEAGQVLGATVPMRPAGATGVYGEEESARLGERFDELFRSLAAFRPEYLARENDASKLPGCYEFPREFRKLRSLVVQFLVDLCRPSQLTVGPFLRGFYFSGVRPVIVTDAPPAPRQPERQAFEAASGATGMFRVGAPQAQQPVISATAGTRKVPQWLFLGHFFSDILLADRAAMGASGASTKTGFWRRVLLVSGAALCLLLAIAFVVSFFNNRALENETLQAARGISAAESTGLNLPSLDSLKRLETLRQTLETLSLYNREGAPLSYRWGLYVGNDLYPDVRRAYFAKFHQLLFGQTQAGLLEFLRALPATPGPDYGPTYDSLKAYLITTSNHDKSTKLFLAPVLLDRWSAGRGVDNDRLDLARRQFEFYAEELKVANPFSSENDGLAIEKARRYLAQFAGTERVYQFMLAEASKTNAPVNFNRKFPGSAAFVVDGYEVAGPFTKGGWDFMKNALRNADKYFAGERWVLGDYSAAQVDRAKLEAELRQRYYSDFIRQWRSYLKAASVVRYAGLKDAASKLNTLSGNQSPLLALFWLCTQNTAVDDPAVSTAFQPVHTVVPPSALDRYIAPPNQNYMNALVSLQASIDQVASAPGGPNDAAAAQTLSQATNAHVTTRQVAQAFRIDSEAHVETTVQKLMEDPITYAEALLRTLGPAELNAKGKAACAQFRSLLAKYPFNSASSVQATLQEFNGVFGKPGGVLWALYDPTLQKLLPKVGNQYVAQPGAGLRLNPAFVSFFNRAAAFSDAAYASGADPRFGFTLKPVPTEGAVGASLRLDGQTISGSQAKAFVWQGGGTHEAVATVKFGGSDLGWANYQGLWAAFQFFNDAERWAPAGSGWNVEWIVRVGRNPVTLQGRPLTVQFHLEMNNAPNVFQKGYFSGLACVSEVARP